MHHYRCGGESPHETANLGSYIKYVQVKDSVMVDDKVQYRMMGEGDLPITEMLDALVDIGYDGYISLEWVKRWAQGSPTPAWCSLGSPTTQTITSPVFP